MVLCHLHCLVVQWRHSLLSLGCSVVSMEDLDRVKGEVWSKLVGLTVEELTAITAGLSLTVADEKKGLKSELYAAVVKHLMSDVVDRATDDGLELFTLVNTIMDQVLLKRVKVEVPVTDGQLAGVDHGAGASTGPTIPAPLPGATPAVTDGVVLGATTSVTGVVANTSVPVSTPTSTISLSGGYAARTESAVELAAKLLASLTLGNPLMSTQVQQHAPVPVRPYPQMQRLKDFKINGVVGGGEGQLDYVALKYSIKEGKQKGYTLPEIISGVIAALKPGHELRKFFEATPNVSEERFNKMIKSHYKIQSATNCLTELTSCVQEPTQGDREYVTKMMRLKNTLLVVAEEEGFHMNSEMVYQSFTDAVSVGLIRNRATRLELQPFLEKRLEDEDLSWELNKIVTRDEEYRRKMKGGPKAVSANALDAEEVQYTVSKDKPMSKEDIIISELRNLSSDVKELKTVKEDVQVLQKRMDGYDRKLDDLTKKVQAGGNNDKKVGDGTDKRKSRFDFRCEECQAANKRYCPHCNKCGESDHKRKDCTKN